MNETMTTVYEAKEEDKVEFKKGNTVFDKHTKAKLKVTRIVKDRIYTVPFNFPGRAEEWYKAEELTTKSFFTEQEEDPVDTITMDIPLFLRMLEYSREDASEDMDLHDVTEKANKLGKERGILQMDDYDEIVDEEKDALKEFLTSPEWNKMSKEDRIKLLQKYFPKLSLKFADWKWDDLTPMIKNKLIGKKDNLKETILNVLKSKKISPKK